MTIKRADPSYGPIAKHFEHLAPVVTPKAKTILVKADQVADAFNLDNK